MAKSDECSKSKEMESGMNDMRISETRSSGEQAVKKEITMVPGVTGLKSLAEYLAGNRKAVKIKQCDREGNRDLGGSSGNPSPSLSIGLPVCDLLPFLL